MLSESFPPQVVPIISTTTRLKEVESALSAITMACDRVQVTYLSVPVTGGPVFVDWWKRRGHLLVGTPEFAREHRLNVVAVNTDQARVVGAKCRSLFSGIVVNPSLLNLSEWGQREYLLLFISLIERIATRVVACDGWCFSKGCALEIACAMHWGVPVFSAEGVPVSRVVLAEELCQAIDVFRDAGISTTEIGAALDVLRSEAMGARCGR
jgi:hypothetical protein